MANDVVITSNVDEILELLEKASGRALMAVGMAAETNAKRECTAVDTGRLRNSITYATKDKSGESHGYADDNGKQYTQVVGPVDSENVVYIGTNVEYAEPIEYGHHAYPGIHFLKNGVANYIDEYKNILEEAAKSE